MQPAISGIAETVASEMNLRRFNAENFAVGTSAASDHGLQRTVNATDSASSGFRAITLAPLWKALSIKEEVMTIGTILLIILILALIGSLPTWGYSRSWGYGPTGGVGLIVIIVVILLVLGYI